MSDERRSRPGTRRRIGKTLRRARHGARNALEWIQKGRLGAPYSAPHEIVLAEGILRLRHYAGAAADGEPGPPLLLVPPLMVTAEVYDISPELSATAYLAGRGIDLYVADFGVPEQEPEGLARTVDDHVLAVDRAVSVIAERTQKDVHIAGYSQGGMFAYLVAAFRRSAGVASVITFGAPVDMRKNLPVRLREDLASRVLHAASGALGGVLSDLEALPGNFTSYGFKLISPRQELKHMLQMFGLLADREALVRREPTRRFLGGEGFTAWPGPALRTMVTEFVARNRMQKGGMVIGGRPVALADMTCPILYFVGTRDEIARPPSVRAIERAAGATEVEEVAVETGHFGLVVGTRALGEVWPTVADWVAWKAGQGARPARLGQAAGRKGRGRAARPEPTPAGPAGGLYELATDLLDGLWRRLGDVSGSAVGVVDAMRWQLPRLARLLSLRDEDRTSLSLALAEQAAAIPDAPFFLWQDRAFSYGEANLRVGRLARALRAEGVRKGDAVGLFMDNHPDLLTSVCALNRIGAVAVLLPAEARGISLEQALAASRPQLLLVDPAHAERARASFAASVLLLGLARAQGPLPEGVRSLDEALVRPEPSETPAGPGPGKAELDAGRASDLALLLFTSGTTGLPKPARITNRRAILAALGTAAACSLSPADTVYCCLPLHHATGLLVACGGALVGGARLALAPRFRAETFWAEVRRVGATCVFYVGELGRHLVSMPPAAGERNHPVRLFCGNGLQPDVWRRLLERFGPAGLRVLEFYASTEGNVVLVNLAGEKMGAVGRDPTGEEDLLLARFDSASAAPVRGPDGRVTETQPGEPGLLLVRVRESHPLRRFDGYLDPAAGASRLLRGVRDPGDEWFSTGDLLRRDADGDYWFVDRLGDTFRWKGENVSTEQVAEVLRRAPFVQAAAVYGVAVSGREGRAGMAAIELSPGRAFDGAALGRLVAAHLTPAARPRYVRLCAALDLTPSLKLRKRALTEEGADPARVRDPLFVYDETARAYRPLRAGAPTG